MIILGCEITASREINFKNYLLLEKFKLILYNYYILFANLINYFLVFDYNKFFIN